MGSITGVVLAGGKSERFGSPKASATFRGRLMLEWVVAALAEVADDVIVVCAPGQVLPDVEAARPIQRVDDDTPHAGPLAGAIRGLRAARGEWALVVGCDMPLLGSAVLRELERRREGAEAVVPRIDGRLQPLAALYRCDVAREAFERAWANGVRSIMDALRGLRLVEVTPEVLPTSARALLGFRSINTAAELAQLDRELGADDGIGR